MSAAAAAVPVLREVRLYGHLRRRFGAVFRLAVATPAEAVRALRCVLPGFERALVGADGTARYHVLAGTGAARRPVAEDDLVAPVGAREAIRIVPEIAGAKRGGLGQTILGSVLVVAGIYFGQPLLVNLGASLALGGIIQMLSPQRVGKDKQAENLPSYAFDGPQNIPEQGGPVPVAYGRVVTGSTVVSQGLSTVQTALPAAYGPGAAELPNHGLPPWEERESRGS